MTTARTQPPLPSPLSTARPPDLYRLAGIWFLGLAGLQTLYSLSAFFGLESDFAASERIAMAFGPTVLTFSLLVSPSVFAAGMNRFDLLELNVDATQRSFLTSLGLFAVVGFSLSAVGSTIAAPPTTTVQNQQVETLAPILQSALDLATLLIPIAIATLTFISGVAGALVGLATRGWEPRSYIATAWFACLVLIASFLVPFLIAVNSIVHHGASPIWILIGPLALPLLLTGGLVWHQRHWIGIHFGALGLGTGRDSVDAETLDRIISEVTAHPETAGDALDRPESERELARLVAAIRHVAGDRARMSESRVQEIVAHILAASPPGALADSRTARQRFAAEHAGVFCASWVCLAAGLLIVSPFGGVPPSVVSALAVGFIGSAGILFIGSRHTPIVGTVPP